MNKQALTVGIDISKDDFHACVKERQPDGSVKIKGSRKFANSENGFEELVAWAAKRGAAESISYVMEATGAYYENLAYDLYERGSKVFVVLPNKVKHFIKSLNLKTKTDKVDASAIAQIGVERTLPAWIPMAPHFRLLRDLCREMLSLKKEKARATCQLHAMRHAHQKMPRIVALKEEQIAFYEESILEIEKEIEQVVAASPNLAQRIAKVEKAKGLGLITIVTLLCETNGFLLFSSIRQAVSYAGLDVELKESGKYVGKSKISKKGNARIRQCLYMPALSAIQHNAPIKNLYDRVLERNPNRKRKGVVAAMRKLLILIFVLWKKDEEYDPNYEWKS